MQLYLILATTFITVFLLMFTVLRVLRKKYDPTIRRVRDLTRDTSGAADQAEYDSVKRSRLPAGLEKALENLQRLGGIDPAKDKTKTKNTLQEAGIRHEFGPILLLGTKLSSAFLLFAVYYAFLARLLPQPSQVILMAVFAVLVGFCLPDLVLRYVIAQRRQEIGESLSDALDLLVICMEAGLGLNASLLRVAQELDLRSPILSKELLMVTQEMRTGLSREIAMRNLCVRNKVENLRILVGALILADKLGTSLADTLRAQADSLRTRLRQSAEEQAAKSGIKMLIPLVLFIFPALFIVVLGPGFLSIIKNFAAMSGQ